MHDINLPICTMLFKFWEDVSFLKTTNRTSLRPRKKSYQRCLRKARFRFQQASPQNSFTGPSKMKKRLVGGRSENWKDPFSSSQSPEGQPFRVPRQISLTPTKAGRAFQGAKPEVAISLHSPGHHGPRRGGCSGSGNPPWNHVFFIGHHRLLEILYCFIQTLGVWFEKDEVLAIEDTSPPDICCVCISSPVIPHWPEVLNS